MSKNAALAAESTAQSCPRCGAEGAPGAKFCGACGNPLGSAANDGATAPHGLLSRVPIRSLGALAVAFMLGGALTAAYLSRSARHPRSPEPSPMRPAAAFHAQALPMPPGHFQPGLPGGHPAVAGHQVNAVVLEAEKQARSRPSDIAVWNRYADIAMRFGVFNPVNYQKARDAFAHVLQIAPGNREALRGLGDVYFDMRQYKDAIDAYRRYLRQNPNDCRALTDLGTMYLSEHEDAQAIKEYRSALALKPDFFPARFNIAVAYLMTKDYSNARDALAKARTAAPSAAARTRIDEMIATIEQSARKSAKERAASSKESPGASPDPG